MKVQFAEENCHGERFVASLLQRKNNNNNKSLSFENNISFRKKCQLASEQADSFMGDSLEKPNFRT